MGFSSFTATPDVFGQLGSQLQQFGGAVATPFPQFGDDTKSSFLNDFTAQATQGFGNRFADQSGFGQSTPFVNNFTSSFGQDQGQTGGALAQAGGQVSKVGGAWSALDQHNNEIAQAAAQYGVPANLLKSMINRESSGNWNRDNRVYEGLRGQRMLPFVGIFEDAANSWGLDFNSMIGNKAAQIGGMAKILNGLAQQYGGFENAAKVYFGGEQALNGNFVDEYGMDSNTYGNKAIADWKYLDSQSGFTGSYDTMNSFGGGWESTIPGGALFDWGEFGSESDNGLYGYGTAYGMSGTQHTGIDVTAPRGTAYYAPTAGVVMCAGTGVGQSADGSGCAAFGDTGGGAGRVEVLLDNGAVLIYGHSAASALQPGQRFNAGDVLGQIGTMNSDHAHLEARVKDPSTPSGWRIVDPRSVLGGGGMPMPQFNGKPKFSDLLKSYLIRK